MNNLIHYLTELSEAQTIQVFYDIFEECYIKQCMFIYKDKKDIWT